MAKNPPSGADPYGPPAGSTPPPTSYQQVPPGYQQGPPPGYQQGPPPGYQPGPPPGYQQGPPPGYQQGPPPGYQPGPPPGMPPGQPDYQPGPPPGYQQGPPPGYQQGPPPGYQPGPPPGYQQQPAYGQQQPGYPPPGTYGPQGGQPGYAGAYPPAGGPKPSFDVSKLTIAGWGVLGSALLTLIASFFPFWSVTGTGTIIEFTVSLNGWSLWWWLPVLLATAVGVVYALQLFGVLKPNQVKGDWLVYGAAASFVLMLIVLVQTFLYGGSALGYTGYSHGPSFGVFIAVVTTAALTYFMALVAQSAGAKLPFKVPGPA
ncbi:MAG: hypothetical protein U0R72_04335 [Nakamurella multipartita]